MYVIIGIALVAIGIGKIDQMTFKNIYIKAVIQALVTVIGGVFICAGLLGWNDYEDWKIEKEVELVPISDNTVTGVIYATVSEKKVYTYRHKITSEFATETSTDYETETVWDNVIESEDINCKKPVLLEYKRKRKPTIWSFQLYSSETKYVFHVPEGTISHEITLN